MFDSFAVICMVFTVFEVIIIVDINKRSRMNYLFFRQFAQNSHTIVYFSARWNLLRISDPLTSIFSDRKSRNTSTIWMISTPSGTNIFCNPWIQNPAEQNPAKVYGKRIKNETRLRNFLESVKFYSVRFRNEFIGTKNEELYLLERERLHELWVTFQFYAAPVNWIESTNDIVLSCSLVSHLSGKKTSAMQQWTC